VKMSNDRALLLWKKIERAVSFALESNADGDQKNSMMYDKLAGGLFLYLCLAMSVCAQVPVPQKDAPTNGLEPFSAPPAGIRKLPAIQVFQKTLNCLGTKNAAAWKAAGVPLRPGEKLFALEAVDGKDALRLISKGFEPGQTFVGHMLSPDDLKSLPNYISFQCKSTGAPVDLSVYVVGGKTLDGAAFKLGVPVSGGAWQRVVLPLAQFPMKPGTHVMGLGFGINSTGTTADVLVSDLTLGAVALSAEALKAQNTLITLTSLKPAWKFAPDPSDIGLAQKWSTPEFDDSGWKTIKSGAAWQEQGIAYDGWAWYRQKILVPKEAAGVPLAISLTEIPYEDEVYFNGTKIGGLTGNYPYANLRLRTYTAPPSLIHYGEPNTIAIRAWGTVKGGLVAATNPKCYLAELDPLVPRLRLPGEQGEGQTSDHFDLGPAQQGMPFDIIFRFPADVLKDKAPMLSYTLADFTGQTILRGTVPVTAGKDGLAQAIVSVDNETSQVIYLRGRFRAYLAVNDAAGIPICLDTREFDHFSFAKRDVKDLPALAEKFEDTTYGKLKLIDTIDCTVPVAKEEHPYMQSAASHVQDSSTPGADLKVQVREILGKKAREMDEAGWFAYRIGRGKLEPHKNYLLRVEYPEDKTRYSPMEIQNGHNYMDIGWKNGVSADDPYDNWPLSHAWQNYDAIFSLDDETTGTSGTGGASAEHGVWVYFMNRKKTGRYFERYEGGPAIASLKLYEIDPVKNAPVINLPKDMPHRVLMVDWERQADQPPEDIVRYAKLMGYSAIAPIMLKWDFMNYGPPMDGYMTTIVDAHRYWIKFPYAKAEDDAKADDGVPAETTDATPDTPAEAPAQGEPAKPAAAVAAIAAPPKSYKSVHLQYLDATKKYGVDYIPRIEYGGSLDLPVEARAINGEDTFAKPNRFAAWSANLLHPATWDDLAKTVDNYFKPYVKDNPQLTGMLWRIRCDRMQISYGRGDVEMYAKETGTKLPEGLSSKELAAWASMGENGEHYADWWQKKREDFHAKLVALLKSYRPDLTLYYYNWDADKWSMGFADFTAASYFVKTATARFGLVSKVYERDYRERRQFTGEDYVRMLRSGQVSDYPGWGRDYALRTDLYKDLKGMELFAPTSWLYLADNPTYLNYFETTDGVAVSNAVSYDEAAMRSINPKFECNMVTPAGAAFSMATEVLAWFHADARTLTYTVYTYGRGFADAHRRFAQAFLALPAAKGTVVDQADKDLKVRTYASPNGIYIGVAYKGYAGKKLTIKVPAGKAGAVVKNLVTNETVPSTVSGSDLQFDLSSGPMELNAFLVQ